MSVALLVACLTLAWGSTALAANYSTSGVYLPIVRAGPGGHAVAVAGFGTVGTAFAWPGGAFGALAGTAPARDALALDARGGATALYSINDGVQAFVAPPGGTFGPAVNLGVFNGERALLAVDRGGAAAAAWIHEGRLRVAVRLAGMPFAPAVDAGPASGVGGVAISSDGTVSALVTRPAPAASSTTSRSDAVLVTIRPRAGMPETVVLAGEEGLALARSVSGQLLAVMQAGARLVAQLIDASGRPAPGALGVGGPGSGYVDVLGAVLEPDGRAVVAWTVPAGRYRLPGRVLVGEGDAAAAFAEPRRLDRAGEVSGAMLAANERGDAVLVWSAVGYRPRAALRPAGATFGAAVVVSARAGWPPTAGVLPDGQALVGWTEQDGMVSRQLVARLSEAGAALPQVLAEASLRLRPRQRARCRAARRSVLARNRFAVYRRVGRGSRREICSLITGVSETVQDGDDFVDSVRLAGPLAARASVSGEDAGTDQYAEAVIVVYDTRTGRSPGALGVELGEEVAVGDLVLAPDGAYAVTVCSTGYDLYGEKSPTRLARRLCARPGARVQVIVVDEIGPGRRRVISKGRAIDPRSLRLRGRRVTWQQNRRTRTTTLRRIQLPG